MTAKPPPTHPDFQAIVQTVASVEAAENGFDAVVARVVDPDTLGFISVFKAETWIDRSAILAGILAATGDAAKQRDHLINLLGAMYADGFTNGALFQQGGGHQNV